MIKMSKRKRCTKCPVIVQKPERKNRFGMLCVRTGRRNVDVMICLKLYLLSDQGT